MSGNVRILAPVPGTNLVGIEVANEAQDVIGLRSVLESYKGTERLPIAIGVDTVGQAKIFDLTKMFHVLIAGQTGSGKSVCINSIILSLLYTKTPDECQLILVDPKRVEMTPYHDIPHLRCPVVTEPAEAPGIFSSLIAEMERRYEVLAEKQVRNIEGYNELGGPRMPYIVTVVDEMADLMMTSGKGLEKMIVRLAQLSRAVGIHLVLATQKPIVEVITGMIKSNMPSRIAFRVASNMDSRVILDCGGAEKLVGRGDMLVLYPGISEPERYHGAWVSDDEIRLVTGGLGS
jgi:S-DNA-T family DNA segregation ATPase FtsK/SpoIIIE